MIGNNNFLFSSEEKYSELPCNIYVKDSRGILLYINEFQAKSLGFSSPNDIIGINNYDLVDGKVADIIRSNDQNILNDQKPKTIIEQGLFHQTPCSFLSYKIPLYHLSNKSTNLLGISIPLNDNNFLSTMWCSINRLHILHQKMLDRQKNNKIELEGKAISPREKECLYYLIRGMTAKGIARQLNLSPRTVEYYIENMKKKFHCHNKTELIIKAVSII